MWATSSRRCGGLWLVPSANARAARFVRARSHPTGYAQALATARRRRAVGASLALVVSDQTGGATDFPARSSADGGLMPTIYDNIDERLLPALSTALTLSGRSDFCVGYFNLRGWRQIDHLIDRWAGGAGQQCRLLVGMQTLPQQELRDLFARDGTHELDNATAAALKRRLATEFREQLTVGFPTNDDENGLRRLLAQLRAGKVTVKLFLRHPLHAKLYLAFRADPVNPIIGYLGSSNLTLSGLSKQGELNVDVLDNDAAKKLSNWFEDRWNDRWCVDISSELIEVLEQSWAREELLPPFHIYVKMAYHLAQEARAGLSEFRIPPEFGHRLFDYQVAAVKIAAHHLNKRGGVLIGDVVGLGKTLMATALAKIFQDDHFTETLIICPKNLVKMWEDYVADYRLLAKVMSISTASRELPTLRRYRVVLIDESQNLRNREGKRYRAIQEYIQENESRCILLSATPYNKTYLDLSSQLRLFVPEDEQLGIRPERLLRDLGETEFIRRYQCPVHSLAAFEKSEYADDWRELMRLYMVRRTRSFIQDNYATLDPTTGRKFLTFEDGTRSYFPERKPKTVKFKINERDPKDQYARLYASDVVTAINALNLPRYGLANYVAASPHKSPTPTEAKQLQDLSRAGKRLMGFCRTNLFKRLESSGEAFQQSIERHILRNHIFIHAVDNGLPLPIGTQDAGLLDAGTYDEDIDDESADAELFDDDDAAQHQPSKLRALRTTDAFKKHAAEVYQQYASQFKSRFKWLRSDLFVASLGKDLSSDAASLLNVLNGCGDWKPEADAKLDALYALLSKQHPKEKVIVFTQYADTVRYLEVQLRRRGLKRISGVTGEDEDPTEYAWRFSPDSNKKREQVTPERELRVLVATDVLSEGQNLQDAAIVVNFDLPWAIIRLIQRAGRVDRIGQKSEKILCYSFLPADGVENLIRLRSRVRQRLHENAEVVGTDEAFFEDESERQKLFDLYHEKSGILDGDAETEVDLASYAYQIWKNAIDRFPQLQKTIPELPPVVYSTRAYEETSTKPHGVLVYLRTAEGNDALAWVDKSGNNITESQFEILKAAECTPETVALPRQDNHHDLVRQGVEFIAAEEKTVGGQLGRPSGARFRTYERLKRYAEKVKGTLFDLPQLAKSIEEIYRYPLRQSATDTLNRQLRTGISDDKLAELVMALRDDDRLCIIHEEEQSSEPQIICSLGLAPAITM
jgi:superfamily II DNA or RNA helicase